MSRSPAFAGVILAAGESSRMGSDKALLSWPPTGPEKPSEGTFLSAAIRSLSLSTDFVVVVVGRNETAIAPIAYGNGATVVTNPDPARGQFSSLQVGLHEVLNHGRDAAIITLVDRPPVLTATVQLVREAFEASPQNIWAVVPEFEGKHGHPYVAGRELIEIFLQSPPTASAREIEHRYQENIRYLAVDDPNVARNINTREEYASLAAEPR